MRMSKRILCILFSALILCAGFSLITPSASAAEYEDGVYSVSVSTLGEGWHNSIVSPTTVYIEGGNIYTDIVFVRTTSPWHAPVYVSLTTAYGTYTDPVIDESNYTCAFYHVHIDSLGEIPFSAVTEAMSMPYSVDYAVYIDPDAVPLKADEPPVPADDPEPSDEPAPAEDPEPADEPAPGEEAKPEPVPAPAPVPAPEKEDGAKPDGSDKAPDKEEPAEEETDAAPADEPDAVPTTGGDPSDSAGDAEMKPAKLGTGAVIGIAAAAVVVIAAVAVLTRKKK